jgi:hypothetical protein
MPPASSAGMPTRRRVAHMSIGAAIAVGAVTGLALGIVVSLATEIPLAPELGLLLGALVGFAARRG